MHKPRFRVLAGMAGATLCLLAVTSYGQNTNSTTGTANGTTGTGSVSTQATGAGTGTTGPATTRTATDAGTTNGTITRGTTTFVTTTTGTTQNFSGGLVALVGGVVVVLLLLFALFREQNRTVVRETYASSAISPATPSVGAGTAADDQMHPTSRAASGTGTNAGGRNDPNARL
ncbi:MAG: hypothetical protein NVS1B5_02510 [Gemmatimonadaceae bacterium]